HQSLRLVDGSCFSDYGFIVLRRPSSRPGLGRFQSIVHDLLLSRGNGGLRPRAVTFRRLCTVGTPLPSRCCTCIMTPISLSFTALVCAPRHVSSQSCFGD